MQRYGFVLQAAFDLAADMTGGVIGLGIISGLSVPSCCAYNNIFLREPGLSIFIASRSESFNIFIRFISSYPASLNTSIYSLRLHCSNHRETLSNICAPPSEGNSVSEKVSVQSLSSFCSCNSEEAESVAWELVLTSRVETFNLRTKTFGLDEYFRCCAKT